MSRFRIVKKDGTPTAYFWTDKDGKDLSAKTVYKQTEAGVKRMRGVHYDAKKKRMVKH